MDDMSVGQTGFSIVTPKGKKPLHWSNCNSRAPYKKKYYIICAVFLDGDIRCWNCILPALSWHVCSVFMLCKPRQTLGARLKRCSIYVSVPNLDVGVFPAIDNDNPARLPKTRFALKRAQGNNWRTNGISVNGRLYLTEQEGGELQ